MRSIILVLVGVALGILGATVYLVGKGATVAAAPDPVLVEIGSEKLTASTVFKDSRHRIYELENSLFKLKRQVVEDYLENRLLAAESSRQNLPVDRLLLKEVGSDAGPVTDEEVDAFIAEKNLPADPKQRDDIREYLKYRKVSEKRGAYLARLKAQANVKVHLTEPTPPQVRVATEGFPSWGSPAAPVTVVEFADFQCPFCARTIDTLERIKKEYGPDKVRIVFRDLPIETHERAVPSSLAAHCAHEQGKFWEYARTLFENQLSLGDDHLKEYADRHGLDKAAFAACFESRRHQGLLERNLEEATALGIDSTPTFVVNGVLMPGAQPFEAIKENIDRFLSPAT